MVAPGIGNGRVFGSGLRFFSPSGSGSGFAAGAFSAKTDSSPSPVSRRSN
jgi:hypothetical protein